jgi:hypothetical protein
MAGEFIAWGASDFRCDLTAEPGPIAGIGVGAIRSLSPLASRRTHGREDSDRGDQ